MVVHLPGGVSSTYAVLGIADRCSEWPQGYRKFFAFPLLSLQQYCTTLLSAAEQCTPSWWMFKGRRCKANTILECCVLYERNIVRGIFLRTLMCGNLGSRCTVAVNKSARRLSPNPATFVEHGKGSARVFSMDPHTFWKSCSNVSVTQSP